MPTYRKEKVEDIQAYLIEGLSSYQIDPADTDFQRGYLTALLGIANVCEPKIYHTFKSLEDQCTRKGVQ
jgi:hypothetical protein